MNRPGCRVAFVVVTQAAMRSGRRVGSLLTAVIFTWVTWRDRGEKERESGRQWIQKPVWIEWELPSDWVSQSKQVTHAFWFRTQLSDSHLEQFWGRDLMCISDQLWENIFLLWEQFSNFSWETCKLCKYINNYRSRNSLSREYTLKDKQPGSSQRCQEPFWVPQRSIQSKVLSRSISSLHSYNSRHKEPFEKEKGSLDVTSSLQNHLDKKVFLWHRQAPFCVYIYAFCMFFIKSYLSMQSLHFYQHVFFKWICVGQLSWYPLIIIIWSKT